MFSRRTFTRTVLSSLTALAFAGERTVRATVAATPLFKPAAMGELTLANRMIMAPMTRGRAGEQRTATALMADYYAQRAGAGLIVTEGTAISEQGYGWIGSPGIYTQAHALGWKKVTDAVHQRGGRIFLQLWHTGRVSHPDFLGEKLPIGPSAVMAYGNVHTPLGKKPYVIPRQMTQQEISGTVRDYVRATQLAREAGFDGVEIHAAYGYLIDQFIRDGSNLRTDKYGGSVPNRLRFLLEVTEAVARAWSAGRVGVRLSPTSDINSMSDGDPARTFVEATKELSRFGLAYLHVVESVRHDQSRPATMRIAPQMRAIFKGSFILNGSYDAATGAAALDAGESDLIAFGRPFLANPDLVERFHQGAPLNSPDPATFYTAGSAGYTDYPALNSSSSI
jgi:N-ethylmaleimide reductase